MDQVTWARHLAKALISDALPRRWAHTQGVGRKAEAIGEVFGSDVELLGAAAWLHDIGYAPAVVATGFHPLDGARYLRDVEHAGPRLCALVANHSCAQFEARRRGLAGVLASEFAPVGGVLADALTFCDITTTPDGEPTDVETRLADVAARYGHSHPVTKAVQEARPCYVDAARAVTSLISAR